MQLNPICLGAVGLTLFVLRASSATLCVDLNSTNPVSPYAGWDTAATNIQDAIDAAVDGDQILVTNGIYQTGIGLSYDFFSGVMTNRVAVTKAIVVQSVNGPTVTVIKGYQVPGTTNGPGAVRCVYLTNNATLIGFTLTNGATRPYPGTEPGQTGGGVYCASASATVSNCVLIGNAAGFEGGGAGGSTLVNCVITGNNARFGGGAAEAVLNNCILTNNQASSAGGGSSYGFLTNCTLVNNVAGNGGGASGSMLVNCLLANNQAISNGGGVDYASVTGSSRPLLINCTLKNNHAGNFGGGAFWSQSPLILINCVLTQNSALNGGGAYHCAMENCLVTSNTAAVGGGADDSMMANCTVTANHASQSAGGVENCWLMNCIVYYNSATFAPDNNTGSGINSSCLPLTGTITNEPLFVNQAGGDYHLQSNSLCINSGNNASYKTVNIDLDGNPRVVADTIDLGAYEFQSPASILSYAWAQQYGLATDGSADFTDPDGDGLNNWQEWMAGTVPTDASSVLKMFSPTNRAGGGLRVSWQSVSGKNYFLQRAADLTAQPAFFSIRTNITGQAGTTTISDTTATNGGPYFYRVGVQ